MGTIHQPGRANLNSIEPILNYSSPAYTSAAPRTGAGVQGSAASAAAHRLCYLLGYRVVTGNCPTVGLAGGYSQGGGHSALSPLHGLGADNVLEWEVVLADGTLAWASPTYNADLYWALSGGGGTYAAVVSMTTRMHRDNADGAGTGGALLFVDVTTAPSAKAFWAAVEAIHAIVPAAVESNAYVLSATTSQFTSVIVTAPGQSQQRVRAHLQPVVDHLDRQGVPYAPNVTTHARYHEHYERYYGPLPNDQSPARYLGTTRLVPRAFTQAATSRRSLTRLFRDAVAVPPNDTAPLVASAWSALIIGLNAPQQPSAIPN
jgi:hypothetical protein